MSAFTLVELLVVMAIILVLAAAILPALKGSLDGINLTGVAESVSSQLSLARQTAASRNMAVEVRLYQNKSTNFYDTIALVIPTFVSGKSVDEFIEIGTSFSGNVIIDADGVSAQGDKFSTLFKSGGTLPTITNPNPPAPWNFTEPTSAPAALRSRVYYAFRFQPDGSTNLPAQDASSVPQAWSISLRVATAQAPASKMIPAPNFVTLVIDPQTGRILPFRP